MTLEMETLRERIKEASAGKKRGRNKVWTEPQVEDFAQGWVLAFDQTLTKTGWVVLVNNRTDEYAGKWLFPGLQIRAGGVLRPEKNESLRSFEETLAKAEAMANAIESVIEHYSWVNAIVHEMPSVAGHRVESSLMAAREIRRINAGRRPVVMISRIAAYATLTGGGTFEKKHMTEAVNRLIPPENRTTERWTQDVHDAAGVALKYLYDKKRGQR